MNSFHLNSRMKVVTFLLPIAVFLIFFIIKLVAPITYASLFIEDSFFEYVQSIFYLLASVVAFFIAKKFLRNNLRLHGALYGILFIGLLVIFMEEISWGQRIFNIANPYYFQRNNVQQEISIHNLKTVQPLVHEAYILIGAYGAFAWLFVRKIKKNCCHLLSFVIPDWYISSCFIFVSIIYVIFNYLTGFFPKGFLKSWDQEPMELLLSLGILLFTVINYIKLEKCLASGREA
jgi:hypothetical protein